MSTYIDLYLLLTGMLVGQMGLLAPLLRENCIEDRAMLKQMKPSTRLVGTIWKLATLVLLLWWLCIWIGWCP